MFLVDGIVAKFKEAGRPITLGFITYKPPELAEYEQAEELLLKSTVEVEERRSGAADVADETYDPFAEQAEEEEPAGAGAARWSGAGLRQATVAPQPVVSAAFLKAQTAQWVQGSGMSAEAARVEAPTHRVGPSAAGGGRTEEPEAPPAVAPGSAPGLAPPAAAAAAAAGAAGEPPRKKSRWGS